MGRLEDLLVKKGATTTETPKEKTDSKKKIVMVVDDEPLMRQTLSSVLSDKYNVITANDGANAVEIYQKNQGNVYAVVMDAKMPGMDGFEASKSLHILDNELPIIMLTAYQDMRSISDIVELNFTGYVTKGGAEIGAKGEVEFKTLDLLKDKLETAVNSYSRTLSERFFAHVKDPEERANLIKFSRLFDSGNSISRQLEDHSIAGVDETERYAKGTSYPENADYILFAKEVDLLFGLKDKKVVEFCSGPGGLTKIISNYQPAKVVGLDGSEYMIAFSKETHEAPNLNYRLCDLFKLSENSADLKEADIIVCQNSMHHFSDGFLQSFFKAGIDLLKKGGSFYVSDYRREDLDAEFLSQRLIATNKLVRQDLVNTIQSSLTKEDIAKVLDTFGDSISYKIFYPDEKGGVFDKLKSQLDYGTIIANDPHPHNLDYKLSLRVEITKK